MSVLNHELITIPPMLLIQISSTSTRLRQGSNLCHNRVHKQLIARFQQSQKLLFFHQTTKHKNRPFPPLKVVYNDGKSLFDK